MSNTANPILSTQPLGPLWPTLDPFLFCAHHDDAYPAGDGALGVPAEALSGAAPLPPPPESWAAQADADVAIWTLRLAPGARWALSAARGQGTRRMLYWFAGAGLAVAGAAVAGHAALEIVAHRALELHNGGTDVVECLLLQGRPIGEPVVQHGPFVMNTREEIMQALQDYRRTEFGGWPWKRSDPVHGAENRRFARHPGRTADERPPAG